MLFGTWVMDAAMRNCHVLITVNRIWAVFWPQSYCTVHSRSVAGAICLAVWVTVLVLILPGYLLDALYYREPLVIHPCRLNAEAQWAWAAVMQFLVFDLCELVMLAAYPVVWYKRCHQRRRRQVGPSTGSAAMAAAKAAYGNIYLGHGFSAVRWKVQ